MNCTYNIPFNGGDFKENQWLKSATGEQKDFSTYLDQNPNKYKGKKCLHVGTGNSSIAKNHHNIFKHIDGIAIDPGEVELGNNLKISNYTCHLVNKYKLEEISILGEYDVIIDNNIKHYACCGEHYMDYFDWILDSVASRNGEIITHVRGYHSLDNIEIDKIAKRVQYKSYQEPNQNVVFIRPI